MEQIIKMSLGLKILVYMPLFTIRLDKKWQI